MRHAISVTNQMPTPPLPSLAHDVAARPYRKLPAPVRVIFALADGSMQTLEGEVEYAIGDAIVTGPAGDSWPINRARFNATYTAVAPTLQGDAGWYSRRPNRVLAKKQSTAFQVLTPQGAVLKGQPGDWLVEYSANDQSVVAQTIFAATYELINC